MCAFENYLGDSSIELCNNNCNHEIEDFIYPEVMCYLVNLLLQKRMFIKVNVEAITKKIAKPSFKNSGILALIDSEKNDKNPYNGQDISFVSSGQTTAQIKNGLAGLFTIKGGRELSKLIQKGSEEYPFVKEFLVKLFEF